jgi:hypothetical protein
MGGEASIGRGAGACEIGFSSFAAILDVVPLSITAPSYTYLVQSGPA